MLASVPREAAFTTQTRADINFPKGWRKDQVHAATTTAPLLRELLRRQGGRTSKGMADGIMTMTEGEVLYSTLRSPLTLSVFAHGNSMEDREASRCHCMVAFFSITEATEDHLHR